MTDNLGPSPLPPCAMVGGFAERRRRWLGQVFGTRQQYRSRSDRRRAGGRLGPRGRRLRRRLLLWKTSTLCVRRRKSWRSSWVSSRYTRLCEVERNGQKFSCDMHMKAVCLPSSMFSVRCFICLSLFSFVPSRAHTEAVGLLCVFIFSVCCFSFVVLVVAFFLQLFCRTRCLFWVLWALGASTR